MQKNVIFRSAQTKNKTTHNHGINNSSIPTHNQQNLAPIQTLAISPSHQNQNHQKHTKKKAVRKRKKLHQPNFGSQRHESP